VTDEAVVALRRYRAKDEPSWLQCRALAFLSTDYYDDVWTSKPTYEGDASIELVAAADRGAVLGLLDVAVDDALATIETIAVHPDAARAGIGTQLLRAALHELPEAVTTIDAWTREDAAANAWYLANGFRETFRYLHVYASTDAEISSAVERARPDLTPVVGFFHAAIEGEARLREAFDRVYVCRRYERPRAS
jgi:ribosomal protein S18 acetylase RimI-like enzyme